MYKNYYLFLFAIVLTYGCKQEFMPQPTEVKLDMEDGELKDLKKEYFEKLHWAAPDVSWKQIEHQNAINKHQIKAERRKNDLSSRDGIETVANGNISGEWIERGSQNQSGSVFDVVYDQDTDELYLVSAGGSIFKGKRDGSEWNVIQQDLRFANRYLFLSDTIAEQKRLISAVGGDPYYSDDGGTSWLAANGMNGSNGWRIKNAEQLDSNKSQIFLLFRKDWWSDVQLYTTEDAGENYRLLYTFGTSDLNNIAMVKPHFSDEILIIEQFTENQSQLYKWNHTESILESINPQVPFSFGADGRANLVATQKDGLNRLYSYDGDNMIYMSEDGGMTWETKSEIPIQPWEVAIFLSKSNPDILFTGGVNAYRSVDQGETWDLINEWYEYYDNVEFALHADIMAYDEYTTKEGQNFLTISNHGGLSISYDQASINRNIALSGLNVSQYYDVTTQPGFDDFVYAGAQDQGFQRGNINTAGNDIADLEQVISGDYGHTEFTDFGSKLWTVYPGGWISYYGNPVAQGLSDSYDIISDNESVWIPPIMPHPDPSENIIYAAGGSAEGGAGRYIIELKKEPQEIVATNLPFDFTVSGGNISAMATSPFDANLWLVATDNGAIYKSTDGAQSFTEASFNVPGGHYLYGSHILFSKLDPNLVYLSGSGYSNPGVYRSTDGGNNWSPMSFGLPQTTVFKIVANADESMIFAATEAGPYVYVQDEQQWFDMSGLSAPNQTYWSVEYLENSNVVRFGTYGRGIWDFRIDQMVNNQDLVDLSGHIKLFPNPVIDVLNIQHNLDKNFQYQIFDIRGNLQQEGNLSGVNTKISLRTLASGQYVFKTYDDKSIFVEKFIKM